MHKCVGFNPEVKSFYPESLILRKEWMQWKLLLVRCNVVKEEKNIKNSVWICVFKDNFPASNRRFDESAMMSGHSHAIFTTTIAIEF